MKKYENVDIVAILGAVMETNTRSYKSDFRYDVEIMSTEAVKNLDGENNRFLWLSRPSGTECFREREVFIRDAWAFISWTYYADRSDSICAYAVEITGEDKGKIMGNLYELDYSANTEMIRRDALPAETVTVTFEDGTQKQFSYMEYNSHITRIELENGRFKSVRTESSDENAIKAILKREHAERQKYRPAVFKAHRALPAPRKVKISGI